MPDVTLQRENERELVFANRPAAAFTVGLGFALVGYATWALLPDRRRWFLLAVALVAVAISAAAMLRRERLVLDLANHRYLREAGYWPRPERRSGSLAEVEHVELALRARSRGLLPRAGRRQQLYWVVSLKFRGNDEPYALLEERSERRAYNRFEALARKLRVPALDRTGGEDRLTPWEQVEQPLAERQPAGMHAPVAIPPPPAASGIRFSDVPGRRRIELPAHGFNYGVPVLYLLPAALVAFGAALLWQSAQSGAPGGFVLAAVFLLIGLGLGFLFSAAVFGHEWIAESREHLLIGNELAGITWRRQRIAKRDLRAIEIRKALRAAVTAQAGSGAPAPVPTYSEVVLRATTRLRRFGAHLSPEERAWLRDALVAMAR